MDIKRPSGQTVTVPLGAVSVVHVRESTARQRTVQQKVANVTNRRNVTILLRFVGHKHHRSGKM